MDIVAMPVMHLFWHREWLGLSTLTESAFHPYQKCVRARQCVHIGPYSQTTLMSLGAAHPLPNWRKNISYWKYDSVWKGKKVYEKQEAENITCGLIEMIRCFKGPELLGGGGVPSTSKAAAFSCCKRTLTRANYTKQYPHVKSQKIGKYF